MAVLESKRTLSTLEFYKNAICLRKSLAFLLMRDLGTKSKVRDYKYMTRGMDEKDAAALTEIMQKYHYARMKAEWPAWVIVKLRNSIWELMRDMMINITHAYTIWATCRAEADERRVMQDRAIGDCESILKELEFAIEILPVDVNKYKTQTELIIKEIKLLKGWRKADNKRFRDLK